MTRQISGAELAAASERLVPGSVAKTTEWTCFLKPETLRETVAALRLDPEMDLVHLTNLCGADYWDHFEVVYHIQSFDKNHIATLKVEAWDREKPSVQSLVPVYHGAWMQENEAYDLFGIVFEGHPKPYRILLWEGFPGWPLRKDFLSMPGGLQPGLNEFSGVARRIAPPVSVVE